MMLEPEIEIDKSDIEEFFEQIAILIDSAGLLSDNEQRLVVVSEQTFDTFMRKRSTFIQKYRHLAKLS